MRAVWLTDIFDPALRSSPRSASLPGEALRLLGWNKSDLTRITYLAHQAEQNLFLAYDIPKDERFTKYPEKLLKKHAAKLDTRSLKVNLQVITEVSTSMSAGVKRVINFAKKDGTDLIALQTHSRTGFKRFVLGSFAETMILLSPISLLVLNPDAKVGKNAKRILFATDAEKSAEIGVKKAAQFARKAGATLRLMHMVLPAYSAKFDGQDSDVLKYRKKVDERMLELVAVAKAEGVSCEAVICDDLISSADLILKEAKASKADIVAVQSKAGLIRSILLGSVARHVVRAAKLPVHVIR
jgi:nucleotide-binding universal stress UspA family protein